MRNPRPVQYRGSPYHKRYALPDGTGPAFRRDKEECPSRIPYADARRILLEGIEEALRRGWTSRAPAGVEWPRYAWGRGNFPTADGDEFAVTWEARLENSVDGTYKAYPIHRGRHSDLMPAEIEEALWPDD